MSRNWRTAAERLTIDLYEIVDPEPTAQWAGSYGSVSVGIMAALEQTEIEVETGRRSNRMTLEAELPGLVTSLHFHAVHSMERPWVLPQTWTAERHDRIIDVEGESVCFVGVSLLPDGLWAGTGETADGWIKITCQGPIRPKALRVCTDLALPDYPSR